MKTCLHSAREARRNARRAAGVAIAALIATAVAGCGGGQDNTSISGNGAPLVKASVNNPLVQPIDHFFGAALRPIVLQPGLGPVHMKVKTNSPSAQKWYDQGVSLLFGFAHEEAIRSFYKALEFDPKLAMAWWGISYAYGPNINLAMDGVREQHAISAIRKAAALVPNASRKERAYITIAKRRFSEDRNLEPFGARSRYPLDLRYYREMRRLSHKYPRDINLETWMAEAGMDLHPWKLWSYDGAPTSRVTLEVSNVLENVLSKQPYHPGALHFYAHTWEASRTPNRALVAAERLKSVAWGQPHLVHVPSHIYARNGDWEAATISGEDATAQDHFYQQRIETQDLYTIYHGDHNIHFLTSVLSMSGRKRETLEEARLLHERAVRFIDRVPVLEYLLPYEQLMLVRFGEWKKVLAYGKPQPRFKATTALWHYSRGMAFAGRGNVNQAKRELEALRQTKGSIPRADWKAYNFNFNRAIDIVRLAELVLQGKIAAASGDLVHAETILRRAVKRQDTLYYDEPPAWPQPMREALGQILLARGKAAEAEDVFRTDLAYLPGNGRSLLGLREALRAQGKPSAAATAEFDQAWRGADFKLSTNDLFCKIPQGR